MIYLIDFIVAMSISMALIPLMIRMAPTVGMIDIPDARKVHEVPIPRVGGIGIVVGALVPILLWTQHEPWLSPYIFGCVVLLVFGVWDDIKELGHYTKFIGQLIAVIPVVYYSDLYVAHLPFIGLEEISPAIGKPFTVLAVMGMINAINHSDGLDGLAGGMTTLSLACIGYLAFMAEGFVVLTIVVSVMGGIFGFLRYNNHPAQVFMGDGGSQVLGLTLGVLAVTLTQQVNPALSPALPALFLGLPIMDILAVFWLRAHSGMNWFRATKNHIHHRLLELGFDHYESVVIIYSIQIFFVLCAIFLSYESDWLIISIYLGVCALMFLLLTFGESRNWIAHQAHGRSRFTDTINTVMQHKLFKSAPIKIIEIAIPVFFILIAVLSHNIPKDLAISSIGLVLILSAFMIFGQRLNILILQAAIYVTAAFIIYIESDYLGLSDGFFHIAEISYFVPLAFIIGLAVRYSEESRFKTSPMDYLVIFIALFAGILLRDDPSMANLGFLVVKLVIVFYGCEIIISRKKNIRMNLLSVSSAVSLVIISYKGLM